MYLEHRIQYKNTDGEVQKETTVSLQHKQKRTRLEQVRKVKVEEMLCTLTYQNRRRGKLWSFNNGHLLDVENQRSTGEATKI